MMFREFSLDIEKNKGMFGGKAAEEALTSSVGAQTVRQLSA